MTILITFLLLTIVTHNNSNNSLLNSLCIYDNNINLNKTKLVFLLICYKIAMYIDNPLFFLSTCINIIDKLYSHYIKKINNLIYMQNYILIHYIYTYYILDIILFHTENFM